MISLFLVPSSRAAEQLCDVSFEDCRAPLLALINNESVAIDTAFWFSDDPRFPNALIKAQQRGVKVRVLMDTRSEDAHPSNTTILQTLVNAGIPMRERVATGILHWKMVMCASQGTVEFSGANFTGSELVPVTPYVNYSDEAIYFSDDPAVVNSFKSKYDDWWTDAVSYRDYNPNPMVPRPTIEFSSFHDRGAQLRSSRHQCHQCGEGKARHRHVSYHECAGSGCSDKGLQSRSCGANTC